MRLLAFLLLVPLAAIAAEVAGVKIDDKTRVGSTELVLNGAGDTRRRRAMGDELGRTLPRAERILIPEAGHLPNLDNPDEYNRLVHSFIERHAAAPGPPGATDA